MTDKNYTHILVISDRSGSMAAYAHAHPYARQTTSLYETVAHTMEKGLRGFFAEQANVDGKCLVDFVQFDSYSETVYQDRPVQEATVSISPRHSTALLDAIGDAVTSLGTKLSKMPEVHRPSQVIVMILTDGQENASTHWDKQKVNALINEQQTKYNWKFTFLGANMDAIAEAQAIGIDAGNAMTWTGGGLAFAAGAASNFVSNVRSGDYDAGTYRGYSDEERENANV